MNCHMQASTKVLRICFYIKTTSLLLTVFFLHLFYLLGYIDITWEKKRRSASELRGLLPAAKLETDCQHIWIFLNLKKKTVFYYFDMSFSFDVISSEVSIPFCAELLNTNNTN